MALTEFAPNQYRITVGEFDTEDGISLFVGAEAFARVVLSSAGIAVGDGTELATALTAAVSEVPDASEEEDGTYLLLVTVTDGVAVNTLVDSTDYVNA